MGVFMDDQELLSYIYQNADMGVGGVLQVLEKAEGESFRTALQNQLGCYDRIRSEAVQLLRKRGGGPHAPALFKEAMARVTAAAKTLRDSSPPAVAGMMIRGNAMGLHKMAQRHSEYEGQDSEVKKLAGELIAAQQQGIEQMKGFLS